MCVCSPETGDLIFDNDEGKEFLKLLDGDVLMELGTKISNFMTEVEKKRISDNRDNEDGSVPVSANGKSIHTSAVNS